MGRNLGLKVRPPAAKVKKGARGHRLVFYLGFLAYMLLLVRLLGRFFGLHH